MKRDVGILTGSWVSRRRTYDDFEHRTEGQAFDNASLTGKIKTESGEYYELLPVSLFMNRMRVNSTRNIKKYTLYWSLYVVGAIVVINFA